jgi:hypothetical protein
VSPVRFGGLDAGGAANCGRRDSQGDGEGQHLEKGEPSANPWFDDLVGAITYLGNSKERESTRS